MLSLWPRSVLVCGGRDFVDAKWLYRVLDKLHEEQRIGLIIHGKARGADTMAGNWAAATGVVCAAYPVDWDKYGRAAGSIRNQEMLDVEKPDLVVAFPGGRGTTDMMRRARAAGVEVLELRLPKLRSCT